MQTFDEASRGPFGALMLLYKTKGRSIVAGFASTITILMLAFEPFTQQIIEVHAQEAAIFNASGFASWAEIFTPQTNKLPQGTTCERIGSKINTNNISNRDLHCDDYGNAQLHFWITDSDAEQHVLSDARVPHQRFHLTSCMSDLRK